MAEKFSLPSMLFSSAAQSFSAASNQQGAPAKPGNHGREENFADGRLARQHCGAQNKNPGQGRGSFCTSLRAPSEGNPQKVILQLLM